MAFTIPQSYSIFKTSKRKYQICSTENSIGETNAEHYTNGLIKGMVPSPKIWTPISKALSYGEVMETLIVINQLGYNVACEKWQNRFLVEEE